MRKALTSYGLFAILVLAVACIACSLAVKTAHSSTAAPGDASFADPFSYCAAVGTIDQADDRYSGPKITGQVIQGYLKAAGLTSTTEPSDMLEKATIWRCMDGKVYACNFGANLPCASKANTSQAPTQAMADYCKENQDSDFIPMYITGHETIYSWHCVKDVPQTLDQVDQADAQGYLQSIWYLVKP